MQGDGGHRNEVLTLSWQPISVGGNDDDGNDCCRVGAGAGWVGAS